MDKPPRLDAPRKTTTQNRLAEDQRARVEKLATDEKTTCEGCGCARFRCAEEALRTHDHGLMVCLWCATFVLQAAQVRRVVLEGIRHRGEDLVLDQHRVRVRLDEEVYPVTRPRKDFALDGDIPSQTFFDAFDIDRAHQGVEEEATQTVRAFRVEEECQDLNKRRKIPIAPPAPPVMKCFAGLSCSRYLPQSSPA
jgi:hypothetical protein